MPLITSAVAFLVSLGVMPVARRIGIRLNWVSMPRADRWNRGKVPVLGGVGIFLSIAFSIAIFGADAASRHPGILTGAVLMFAIGLWDDARELSPPVKLTSQIMVAVLVVFSGYRTGFFDSELLNVLVTVAWLVGITNALNLLDNMDGLAGGISLIAAIFLAVFFQQNQADAELLVIVMALCGSLAGFLIFNFPPARIFLGDSGSLLVGFSLASVAIARTPQASNVFAVLGVPALLFALPILDTTFVAITRLMRGQSPAHGGRDHTSHRLVAFGLTERQTVLLLYGIAILSGAAGALLESFDYTLSLVLIPILLVSFSILAAYLSRLKVVDSSPRQGPITNLLQQLAYRRRLFEIALDFFLVSIAYYLAVFTRNGFVMTESDLDGVIRNLPVAVGSAYAIFFFSGIYKGMWGFINTRELLRLAVSVAAVVALNAFLTWLLFSSSSVSFGLQFLLAVFLFIAMAGTRSSFKLLDSLFYQPVDMNKKETARALVYNAGDHVELALRWLETNRENSIRIVGYLDDDPFKVGRRIHNVEVLGGPHETAQIIRDTGADSVIIVPGEISDAALALLKTACENTGTKLYKLQVNLYEI